MTKPFFATKATGLKADLERHDKEALVLKSDISRLEATKDRCPLEEAWLSLFRDILGRLMASRAEVVSKIGKNK